MRSAAPPSPAWYAILGPAMGKASVYVDNVLKATVNLFASSLSYGQSVATLSSLSTSTPHTMVVLGQHRTRATGNTVTVDRFVIG